MGKAQPVGVVQKAMAAAEEEEEGDSELDSFFEDLSTIDDLEMKEEGDESKAEPESGDEEVFPPETLGLERGDP